MKSVWSSIALLSFGVALGAASIYFLRIRAQESAELARQEQEEMEEARVQGSLEPLFFRYRLEEIVAAWDDGKPTIALSVTLASRQVNLRPEVDSKLKRVVELVLLHVNSNKEVLMSGGASEMSALRKGLLEDLNLLLSEAKVTDLSFDGIRVAK